MNKIKYVVADKTDGAFPFIYEHIKEQKTINNRITACFIFTVICLICTDKIIRRQNERIEELDNELKELKQMRGE